MKITFYGAAQNVTGSKHLIESQGYKLLLDCGMHQGKRKESNELNINFPFEASSVNAMILSHGHLDHCGMIPILVRNGFKGKIYCTNATAEIARLIMEDSAKIQEQDAAYYNAHLPEGATEITPLYTTMDVEQTLKQFNPVPYFYLKQEWVELNPRIRFKLYDAGHILGSEIIYLEIKENEDGVERIHTLGYTGDLGQDEAPLLHKPEFIKEGCETLLMESTYGDRVHLPITDAIQELKEVAEYATAHGSKIIVPAFALGRIQEIVYILHQLSVSKEIPHMPVYVDSPLALKLAKVFDKHKEDYSAQVNKDFPDVAPLKFQNLRYIESIEESKQLNDLPGPVMIIAASGMCEGGRILHHLKNNISNPNNTILITGFQAENTLGRKISEGLSPVKIFDQIYEVKAQVKILNEFSAHADQNGLMEFVDKTKGLRNLFLVHTETPGAVALKTLINKAHPEINVEIPTLTQEFTL